MNGGVKDRWENNAEKTGGGKVKKRNLSGEDTSTKELRTIAVMFVENTKEI